jgi:hypothetical protein
MILVGAIPLQCLSVCHAEWAGTANCCADGWAACANHPHNYESCHCVPGADGLQQHHQMVYTGCCTTMERQAGAHAILGVCSCHTPGDCVVNGGWGHPSGSGSTAPPGGSIGYPRTLCTDPPLPPPHASPRAPVAAHSRWESSALSVGSKHKQRCTSPVAHHPASQQGPFNRGRHARTGHFYLFPTVRSLLPMPQKGRPLESEEPPPHHRCTAPLRCQECSAGQAAHLSATCRRPALVHGLAAQL